MTPVANVSQETLFVDEAGARFLAAWKDGVMLAGPSLFGCQAGRPTDVTHWHQLTPKLDVMRRNLVNKSLADAAFAAAMASFFNAAEGQRLMKKVGVETFGALASLLNPQQRDIIATLLINYQGW